MYILSKICVKSKPIQCVIGLFFCVLFCACESNTKHNELPTDVSETKLVQNNEAVKSDTLEDKVQDAANKELDSVLKKSNLVDILTINPSIRVDLKYASSDNFMRKKLYHDIDKLYLQKDVAERLSKVQNYLRKLRPDLSLLVYDGVRPLSVQQAMWDGLDTIPVAKRVKFVSNPANGSIHNYGAAVDLTICDSNGKPLDMGAGYDDIREIAYPRLEATFLASGELTQQHVENRKLLRKVMASQGFMNIPSEWWHFNACTRAQAKARYEIMK